jgi:hypothetical protein
VTSGGCARVALGVAVASSLLGCGEDERLIRAGGESGRISVLVRSNGTADVGDGDGRVLARRVSAEALVERDGQEVSLSTEGCAGTWEPISESPSPAPRFAGLTGLRFRCSSDGLALAWDLYADSEHEIAVAELRFDNESSTEVNLLRLTPLVTRGSAGGLFVGDRLARTRVLDNGSNLAADVDAKLHFADEKRNPLVSALLPIESRGNVVSNWNHAVVDLDSGRSFVAGALTVEHSFPTFGTSVLEDEEPRIGSREGLSELVFDQQLAFEGKPIAPGESLSAEPVYIDPLAPDPFTGLERYADAVAAWQDFTVWTKRDGGRRVPNGWNSWSGSSGSGGLGTAIDEQIMAENLAVMAREFEPFGVDYFQIDDGYQNADGDWTTRDDRFPSGMPALSQKIEDAGLLPGIWISAFTVDDSSELAQAHPDWLERPEDRVFEGLISPGEGKSVLDLSNDGAIDWLGQTMTRYRDEWRMRWIKLDFAYLALPNRPRANPRLTSIEAYKRGIRKLREVLGDDVFYLGIALMGVNYGVVDGMRLTLDTGPVWEEQAPLNLFGEGGNLKQAVKTGSRRYYLNNRVWISHDDLMFFRSDTSKPDTVLTLDEAKTFAAFIGLSGSIVKFGEDLRTLTPEQINVWRTLLPIYPAGARPMDLFERMYPEEYRLDIDGTLAGSDSRWLVAGFLNWGRNYDYSGDDGITREIPDGPRTYEADLGDWGLDPTRTYVGREMETGKLFDDVRGTLEVTVPAHGHAIVALREKSGHPQFLGENRHFTQGATDLALESWDETERRLTVQVDVDAAPIGGVPFEYRFQIYVPDGFTLKSATVGAGSTSQSGKVIEVTLSPSVAERYEMVFDFH